MNKITLLSVVCLLFIPLSGISSVNSDTLALNQNYLEIISEHFKTVDLQNTPVDWSLWSLIKKQNQATKKSASDKTHKLDSLLIEQWNTETGSSEYFQLERWTWDENGKGKTWELYDWSPSKNKWLANDREEYVWNEFGNKTAHIDFDPDADSLEWKINGQSLTEYNTDGNPVRSTLQFYEHSSGTWENSALTETAYNDQGDLTIENIFHWDSVGSSWMNYQKATQTYTSNGDLHELEILNWNITENLWERELYMQQEYDEYGYLAVSEFIFEPFFMGLNEYTNDRNGNVLEAISYVGNMDNKVYENNMKDIYSYSEQDNRLQWTRLLWNASENIWDTSWQVNYLYSDEGYLINEDHLQYNSVLDSLVNNYKRDLVNDELGQQISKTKIIWDADSSNWVNSLQYHYAYDNQKRQAYDDKYQWSSLSSSWIGVYKNSRNFDESDNLLNTSNQLIDTLNQEWIETLAEEYDYDLLINHEDIIYPNNWPLGHLSNLIRFPQFNNCMMQKEVTERIDNQLVSTKRHSLYYSLMISTGIPEIEESSFTIYPNPTKDYINFELSDQSILNRIKIFDIQGRTVISEKIFNEKQISLSHLKSGLYFYKARIGDEIKQGKIIIE